VYPRHTDLLVLPWNHLLASPPLYLRGRPLLAWLVNLQTRRSTARGAGHMFSNGSSMLSLASFDFC
jgi:hypothetical protein